MRKDDLILNTSLPQVQQKQRDAIDAIEMEVFNELNMHYQVKNIPIDEEEDIHTFFIPC